MKYSIIYNSRTGNTNLLAENLKNSLPENNCVYYGEVDEKYGDKVHPLYERLLIFFNHIDINCKYIEKINK